MYGIYNYYCYNKDRSTEISKNYIHDLPFAGATTQTTNMSSFYGIYNYYPYGNTNYSFVVDGNVIQNVAYTTSSRYVFYCYYTQYMDITNNVIDNVTGTSTSSTSYDYYIYYPTAVRCNGNTSMNGKTNGYLYAFYIYYGNVGARKWNEFQFNRVTGNTTTNYMYSVYLYYYNGTNSFITNGNYVVDNEATGSTGYHYFYLYYQHNYQVTNNVVAASPFNRLASAQHPG